MDILDRIQYLMKLNNLSASAFADKIDIQRSSMSHLLSGRNKPSLDFVNKVLIAFPKISADWLLYGKKEVNEQFIEKTLPQTTFKNKADNTPTLLENNGKQVKKVVIFYTDNTFEEIIKA
ncbi:MAG: helix-turn-helix transcriptional regulator [Flavobacteriales bacterium]|nr:helix-turn-helix transcriptional regulator [Flavobacteriales bacterium]